MTKPWDAQVSMTPRDVRDLLASAHGLAIATIEEFGAGWDNNAWLVNREWVFRLPRRELGARIMEFELLALPHVNRVPGLLTPRVEFQGRFSDRQWPYMGYRLIPGVTACRAGLTPAERAICAAPLGNFLRQLHGMDPIELRRQGMCGDTIRRMDIPYRAEKTAVLLRQLQAAGLLADTAPLHALLEQARAPAIPAPERLVHGDLYVRHLIMDDERALRGVIDWGDAHLGHPALDLAIAFLFFEPADRDVFWQAYGGVDGTTWNLARFRALCLNAVLFQFADETRDAALRRETVRAFDLIRQVEQ